MIENNKSQYIKENSELLTFILKNRFYDYWKNWRQYLGMTDEDQRKTLFKESRLELYITNTCNQHCEYCYLVKHPELYPQEYNKPEIILTNLEKIFDYIIAEDLYIPTLDIFTGEIWHSDFGMKVLDLCFTKVVQGMKINVISIPTNASFCMDMQQMYKVQDYIDKFKTYTTTRLQFSLSIDGKIVENSARPLNSKQDKTDEFYDNLFLFAKHNTYYFHPMISAFAIENWVENFNWWIEMCDKYDMDLEQCVMLLEVRNPDWTDEKIAYYNKFIDRFFEYHLEKHCHNSVEEFCNQMLGIDDMPSAPYCPYFPVAAETIEPCTVGNTICIRVGDMALCPCHRTSYNRLLYGHIKLEDNKLEIIANNPEFAIAVLMTNHTSRMGCDTCPFNKFCIKGCFGVQTETSQDPLIPVENVCHFFKEKLKYQVKKYDELGIWDYFQKHNSPYLPEFLRNQDILLWVERIKRECMTE